MSEDKKDFEPYIPWDEVGDSSGENDMTPEIDFPDEDKYLRPGLGEDEPEPTPAELGQGGGGVENDSGVEDREAEPIGFRSFGEIQRDIKGLYREYCGAEEYSANKNILGEKLDEVLDERQRLYQEAVRLGYMIDAEEQVERLMDDVIDTQDWRYFFDAMEAASDNMENAAEGSIITQSDGVEIHYSGKFSGMYRDAIRGAVHQISAERGEYNPDLSEGLKEKRRQLALVNGFLDMSNMRDELDAIIAIDDIERKKHEPAPASSGMDDETRAKLERTARAAERTAAAAEAQAEAARETPEYIKTPEKEYVTFLSYEETGKGKDPETEKFEMHLLGAAISPERKRELDIRLKLADARSKKDHSFVPKDHFPNGRLMEISLEDLEFLTNSDDHKISEAIALHVVMIQNPDLARQKMGLTKSYTEIKTDTELFHYRNTVRRFLQNKLGVSQQDAREYEQAAFNFLTITDFVEEVGVGEKSPLINPSMDELMHPRQKLLKTAKGNGKVWPPTVLGDWARKFKPSANQISLPEVMFTSFMNERAVFDGKKSLAEDFRIQGESLIEGRGGASEVKIDWEDAGDFGVASYQSNKIKSAIQVNTLIMTGQLHKDTNILMLGDAVRALELNERARKALVYLYEHYNSKNPNITGWISVKGKLLGGFREFEPDRPLLFMRNFWNKFNREHPSFLN